MMKKTRKSALNELLELLKEIPREKLKAKAQRANEILRAKAMTTYVSKMIH